MRPPSSNPGIYSQRGPKWAELGHPKHVGLGLANFACLEFSILVRNCSHGHLFLMAPCHSSRYGRTRTEPYTVQLQLAAHVLVRLVFYKLLNLVCTTKFSVVCSRTKFSIHGVTAVVPGTY